MLKYLDEFRQPGVINHYLDEINRLVLNNNVNIMEICGGHTLTIAKYGLKMLLPDTVRLLSGPGCPVCVTPQGYIDTAIELSRMQDVIIASFGDMLRVPGSYSSLAREKAYGADVKVCLSVMDAVEIARNYNGKQVVFLGIGFETTAPTIAFAIKTAYAQNLRNFSVLSALKTIPNAMKAIMESGEADIKGFICPGHVSAVTGTGIYEYLVENYGIPCVVSGFEPVDMLCSISMIMAQIKHGNVKVENQYKRVVKSGGNKNAMTLIKEIFAANDTEWRGLGIIPESGLAIRGLYADFDAARKYPIKLPEVKYNKKCICSDVMRGIKEPLDCSLFASKCTPHNPVGACMVSAEGSCNIYYKYSRH